MIYRVYVEFKPGILDPEAEAIKTIIQLGYKNLKKVSKGKFFDIELSSKNNFSDIKKLAKICYQIQL